MYLWQTGKLFTGILSCFSERTVVTGMPSYAAVSPIHVTVFVLWHVAVVLEIILEVVPKTGMVPPTNDNNFTQKVGLIFRKRQCSTRIACD